MTIEIITNEFASVVLDNSNRQEAPKSPTKDKLYTSSSYAPVSPYSDDDGSPVKSLIKGTPSPNLPINLPPAKGTLISEHKKAENAGRFLEEPLLKENPNRFVLFPIEDNEVSIYFNFFHNMCHAPSSPSNISYSSYIIIPDIISK